MLCTVEKSTFGGIFIHSPRTTKLLTAYLVALSHKVNLKKKGAQAHSCGSSYWKSPPRTKFFKGTNFHKGYTRTQRRKVLVNINLNVIDTEEITYTINHKLNTFHMAFNTKCELKGKLTILGNALEKVIETDLIQTSVSRAYKKPSRTFP